MYIVTIQVGLLMTADASVNIPRGCGVGVVVNNATSVNIQIFHASRLGRFSARPSNYLKM
jgi:hypothetical protein